MKTSCVICNKVNEFHYDDSAGDDSEKKLILTRIWNIFIKYFYLVPIKWEDVSSYYIQKGHLPFCYNCFNKMRQLMECHEQLESVLSKIEAVTSNLTALFKSFVYYSLSNNTTERKPGPQEISQRLRHLQQHIKQQIQSPKTGLVKTFVCDGTSEFVQIGDKFQCSKCKVVKEHFNLMSQHVEDAHKDTQKSDNSTNSKKRKRDNHNTNDVVPPSPICVIKEERDYEDTNESGPSNENSSSASNVHLVNFTVEINRDDSEAAVVGQVETLNNNPLECFYDESEEAQDFNFEEEKISNQSSQNKKPQRQPLIGKEKGEVFKCYFPGCNTTWTSKAHYLYHEQVHTLAEPKFKCSICDCSFVHEENFKLHNYKFHPELTPTSNAIKILSLTSPANNNLLMRRINESAETSGSNHSSAPFPCHLCSKSYWSQTGLSIHSRAHKSSNSSDTSSTKTSTITTTNINQAKQQKISIIDTKTNQIKVVQNTSGINPIKFVYDSNKIQITPTNITQQIKPVQNISSSSSTTSSQFSGIKCSICLENFALASSLQIHLKKVHNVRINV